MPFSREECIKQAKYIAHNNLWYLDERYRTRTAPSKTHLPGDEFLHPLAFNQPMPSIRHFYIGKYITAHGNPAYRVLRNDFKEVSISGRKVCNIDYVTRARLRNNSLRTNFFNSKINGRVYLPAKQEKRVILDPRWLTSSVVDLAIAILTERSWNVAPILGDALMDAGCDNERLLNYCRRGRCIDAVEVVDFLLNTKEEDCKPLPKKKKYTLEDVPTSATLPDTDWN